MQSQQDETSSVNSSAKQKLLSDRQRAEENTSQLLIQ